MTKNEFLEKLRTALANDLSGPVIKEQVEYYRQYIDGELRKGRSEEEVTGELGDPWAIARTIADSEGMRSGSSATASYASDAYDGKEQGAGAKTHVYRFQTWWKKLLFILGVIGVILLVVAVIGGIFSLLMPIRVPLVLLSVLLRLFRDRR